MIQYGWGCYRDIDQGERDLPDLSNLIIQKLDCVIPSPINTGEQWPIMAHNF
jgi:hypothetical protein